MPVETPSRASIETVKAVPNGVSFWSVIWRRPSSSQRSGVRQRQISPRAWVAMKLTASGVDELRGDREVALVLAILVVDDDDEAARADLLDRLVDGGEDGARGLGAHRLIVPWRLSRRSPAAGAGASRRSTYFASTSTSRLTALSGREPGEGRLRERVRDQRDAEGVARPAPRS